MAETKLPRLLAAAKEFNIGQDTLIAFLIAKGFPKDELKPTSKLTEEMYRSLQQEFSSDKAAKMKSDQLELPKGSTAEARKKKEDEDISFGKETKPAPKLVKKEEASTPASTAAETEVAKVAEEKPAKAKAAEVTAKKEDASAPLSIKTEVPEIEGPKVVKKIDLSTIDSS